MAFTRKGAIMYDIDIDGMNDDDLLYHLSEELNDPLINRLLGIIEKKSGTIQSLETEINYLELDGG